VLNAKIYTATVAVLFSSKEGTGAALSMNKKR
jgi:hypothetical protein